MFWTKEEKGSKLIKHIQNTSVFEKESVSGIKIFLEAFENYVWKNPAQHPGLSPFFTENPVWAVV